MAYKNKEDIWNRILSEMITGRSLRSILRDEGMPTRDTVYRWIIEDKKKSDQYARAADMRADEIFDEMMDISDSTDEDVITLDNGNESVNHNVINRDKLKIDTRKWILSKMNPKKYGEKVDFSSGDGSMSPKLTIITTLSEKKLKELIKK